MEEAYGEIWLQGDENADSYVIPPVDERKRKSRKGDTPLEIIKYEETGFAEYPYAVSFNRNAKTLRHFNDFAGVLGRLRVKRYDIKLNAWLIDKQGLEAFEALDKRLFPPKKTMKDKMKDLVSVETKKVSDWENIGTGMKLNLYDYQKQIVKFIIDSHDQEESHDTLIVAPCGAGR